MFLDWYYCCIICVAFNCCRSSSLCLFWLLYILLGSLVYSNALWSIRSSYLCRLSCGNHVSLKSSLVLSVVRMHLPAFPRGFLKILILERKRYFSQHIREHFILQFIMNTGHQHIWRYMVFTGQEGDLESEKWLKLSHICGEVKNTDL